LLAQTEIVILAQSGSDRRAFKRRKTCQALRAVKLRCPSAAGAARRRPQRARRHHVQSACQGARQSGTEGWCGHTEPSHCGERAAGKVLPQPAPPRKLGARPTGREGCAAGWYQV